MSNEEPATEEPATEEPATEEPATEEPATEEPADEEPAAEEPAAEEPAAEEPAAEESAVEQPIEELPGSPSEHWVDVADKQADLITAHYTFGPDLGRPSEFGKTCKGTNKETSEEVAIKMISKLKVGQMNKKEDREAAQSHLISQIKVMRSLDEHPNIVHLIEVYETKENIYLVMEVCKGGDLDGHLGNQDGRRYDESFARDIVKQVGRGIRYLHMHDIAHCGINPGNLVFKDDPNICEVKICDFGMAQFAKGKRSYLSEVGGCLKYMSPEQTVGHYGQKCDIWSLGILTFMLLYGFEPFNGKTTKQTYKKIQKGFKSVKRMYFTKRSPGTPEARDLMSELLKTDPAKRFTIKEVFEHPWLAEDFDATNAPVLTGVLKNLKRLQKKSKFKNEVLGVMTKSHMDKNQIQELKDNFADADANGDGVLSIDELQAVLSNSKVFTDEELKVIIEMADIDGDGKISYEELLKSVVQKKLAGDEARVYKAFQTFDKNGDGKISVNEMMEVLGQTEEEVKSLIAEVDTDKNGEVEYDEFIAMWAKDSGGYLWDEDQEEVKRDIEKTRKEVETRRTSMMGSQPVETLGSSNGTGEENKESEGGEAPAATTEVISELPSAEELLASLKGQQPAEKNEWTSIALGSDDDEPEEKAKSGDKPAKKGKKKRDSIKKKAAKKSGKKKDKPAKKAAKKPAKKSAKKKDKPKKDKPAKKESGKKSGKKKGGKKKKKKGGDDDGDDGGWADLLGL